MQASLSAACWFFFCFQWNIDLSQTLENVSMIGTCSSPLLLAGSPVFELKKIICTGLIFAFLFSFQVLVNPGKAQ